MIEGFRSVVISLSKSGVPRVAWTTDLDVVDKLRLSASWIASLNFHISKSEREPYLFDIKGSLDYDDAAPRIADNHVWDTFYVGVFARRKGTFWAEVTHDSERLAEWRTRAGWCATLDITAQQVFFANHHSALSRATITTRDKSISVQPKANAA